jgi:3-oxoacyl-[acyl-carrier-protein] synthase III
MEDLFSSDTDMTHLKFKDIGIKAISTSIPKTKVKTIEQNDFFSDDYLRNFIKVTDVHERRVASQDTCSSDLCYVAAKKILNDPVISATDINALVFISQTPDYRVPGTSIILQDKLELPESTIAFDVNMTCSGYIYGLFLAYSLANIEGINNVLLLVGETLSKISSPRDKSTALLLGDAGSASLISKDSKYGESYFSLNTDGSSFESVIIPGGGFRNMSSSTTMKDVEYEDGNIRNGEQIKMDGMDVFSFAVSEIPKDVKNLMNYAQKSDGDINRYIFHQANRFMMDVIVKKSKIDKNKMLYSVQKYGNTSGVSIPLTIADQRNSLKNEEFILLSAIGAGFSWGSSILKLVDCLIFDVEELDK